MDKEWNDEGREASPQLDSNEHTGGRPVIDGRVRRIVTRSGRGFRGKFPSLKLGRFVHWESILERDAILMTEYDPSVLSYQEQPCVVTYYDAQGTVRTYTPDLRIERESGETFAEVKPSRKLAKPDLRAKLEAIALRMKERKQPFRILTELEIRREPRYSNAARIHDALRSLNSVDRSKLKAIPKSLKGEQRFGDLVKALGSERQVFRHFVAGNVEIDLDQPISDASLVLVL
jgi:hypothetical protein